MPLERTRIRANYDPNAGEQAIQNFLHDKANACGQHNLGGYFVLGEGDTWIELEGDDGDIDTIVADLRNDSFLSDVSVEIQSPIQSVALNKAYLYHEEDTPITS